MCEDNEISMEFLKRAKELGIANEEIAQSETRFFQPAHLLRPSDAQAFLDLAILCQSNDQLSRAESSYSKALALSPQDYAIPGYLHRVHMVDRLLLNYHRFCSIFNFRQVNVLLKEVFTCTSKKGKKAGVIQRIFRGYRGRLRAAAFREGSCTFYMAQRVFQRGVNISDRRIMLIIEKCGLSFRLDGYDLEACVTYHGFFSHSSSVNLLCYLNWTYGETLCGREFTRKGEKLAIRSVSSVNRLTGECFVDCVGGVSTKLTIPLADCIQAMNLRNFSAGDKDSPILLLPMTVDDTARFVDAIAERAILVPALRMATAELKAKASAGFTISVRAPPKMHFTFRQKSIFGDKDPPPCTPSTPVLQFVFPVTNGLRGVSIGTKTFRKKCARHAVQFTRCRCILPIVSTSAHIEAISRALAPPLPPS
ncbi:hypothetical protein PF002_g2656 [Phytophthora fragariae]|uniref:Uncharacterized protein n=3 Tax=Phytophthora fragariae TaxID=53985 RepID=A0A6A4A9D1_9STRA|nr:hypothetical protein PF002_g2656 [Phytophthora fragariae]